MCSCLSLSRSYIYPPLIPALSHLISLGESWVHLNLIGPEWLCAKLWQQACLLFHHLSSTVLLSCFCQIYPSVMRCECWPETSSSGKFLTGFLYSCCTWLPFYMKKLALLSSNISELRMWCRVWLLVRDVTLLVKYFLCWTGISDVHLLIVKIKNGVKSVDVTCSNHLLSVFSIWSRLTGPGFGFYYVIFGIFRFGFILTE